MTNFDFLKKEPQFDTFADVAIAAERIIHIDRAASVLNCRRAMEFAVKWMYSVDGDLRKPYQNTLVTLMNTDEFRQIVDRDLWKRMDFIRKIGNNAAHKGKGISEDQARLCLQNLFIFMDFVACCYASEYTEREYAPNLITAEIPKEPVAPEYSDIDLEALLKENEKLREELTARRESQHDNYVPKPLDLSEYETRKIYIDTLLQDAGWTEGRDWINEVELPGMPNKSEVGFADYVLYGNDGKALAVVEAKKTCVDVSKGRQQAKLYADLLEKQHGRRPMQFITNGFDIRLIDNCYPERSVGAFYSKRDLEKFYNLQASRTSLKNVYVDKAIAGRYYQEAAVKAVCDALDEKNRRKALLVMATGSGKTRTVISLVDVLNKHGWIKNVLFLADRNSLVTQAKRSFVNLLPEMSTANLCDGRDKDKYGERCIFSTYQTMMNCIDTARDEDGKLYTAGHFDLVICDEAHRSIYNKYRDIFNYFDAPLIGLTATPKDEIDKNTYEIFHLENGVPTYGYDLAQAVKDGYLVDFVSVETTLKFIDEGIRYDELSEEDKEKYDSTFGMEEDHYPIGISSSDLNKWVFNEDTIRKVLDILMRQGLHVDYGEKLGKTIIFAKNHRHAEKIHEIFGKLYPHLPGYTKVIDNYINYSQNAIDEFSDPNKLPQIAISVDMLDTGIDIPEILNLVFFKKVMSKAKFWQMIGRGTRLCEGLMDGQDKDKFYIFDFCGNFEFFRMNKGKPTANQMALQGAIFGLEFDMAYKLQDIAYQTEPLKEYRAELVDDMAGKVQEIDKDNFAVRQHIKYVDQYSNKDNYIGLTYEDTLTVREEVAPYILPDNDETSAVRFDALLYGLELAYLSGKTHSKARRDLLKRVEGIASVANIPEIMARAELIDKILNTDYLERAGVEDFEHIRKELRHLMKYLPKDRKIYDTDFTDDILSVDWHESELENDDLKNYKAKAEYYVREHQDQIAIAKLKSNKPLTEMDLRSLEDILWSEVGTREDYESEFGEKPLGEFVREIVGLDMNAAKDAFAQYLDDTNLDTRQIYFVNQIVEYIVHNGIMKDLSVLQDTPFTDRGSVVDLFQDQNIWIGIRGVIDQINANARMIA
ncbi:MAG: DEAD/DEAH box helicase family protein [Firmicutes bacterium]|nr:DEAD/DEAH box helicase family protein [Bacillota bacterium]